MKKKVPTVSRDKYGAFVFTRPNGSKCIFTTIESRARKKATQPEIPSYYSKHKE